MKKIVSTIILLFLIVVAIRTVRIGMDLRMLHIYVDEQGLHHVYFTDPGFGKSPMLLGEEIFKDGKKIFDSYKENDGN